VIRNVHVKEIAFTIQNYSVISADVGAFQDEGGKPAGKP
jgi:hypothetical protein